MACNGWTQTEEVALSPWSFWPFSSVMAVILVWESDPASVHVGDTSLELLDCSCPGHKFKMNLPPSSGEERERHSWGKTRRTGYSSGPVLQVEVLFSMRNWFQYRMMMSLISNYVFTEILQSLLVCLLSPVIHRCLTLCVCVCACVTERDVIHLTCVRLQWGTHPPPFMRF